MADDPGRATAADVGDSGDLGVAELVVAEVEPALERLAGVGELVRPRLDAAVRLPDGRRLGVAEFGDPRGRAVLWFHGIPGGRHQVPPEARRCAEPLGIRLIAIERPGIGMSTNHLYRRIRDWADDVAVVLDALAVDDYSVVGMSGGGAYAMACAHQHRTRVRRLVLLCSVAPSAGDHAPDGGRINGVARRFRHPMTLLRRPLGGATWLLLRTLRPVANPAFSGFTKLLPASDAQTLLDPAMRRVFLGDLIRNSHRQSHAMMNDATLLGRHWGFDVSEIETPTVVWQGGRDWIVPPAHGEHLARTLPNAELRLEPDEGHLASLRHAGDLLAELL